jgi:ABC-type Fe3+-hydroxamate transport system substrate-binding protein
LTSKRVEAREAELLGSRGPTPQRDASGALVAVPARPVRIVSLVPSITEILFALGLEGRVAGVTIFCSEPRREVARTPKVGREKDPDLARIRALGPDLVLANMEENRKDVVDALRAVGVPVWVTFPRTMAEGIGLVRELGALTATPDAADALARPLEAALAQALARVAVGPRTRVFCPIWRAPYMTVNRDTYVHDVLRTCGGDNVFAAGDSRYPTVTLEEVRRAAPDVILLPDEPYRFRTAHLADFAPLADVPAVRSGRIHFVDGKLLSWYGPRIAESLERLPPLLGGAAPTLG